MTGAEQVSRRRRPGERPVWAFDPRPGSQTFAALVSPEEYAAIVRRGYATLDGVRADLVLDDCDEESGFLRFFLAEPYRIPAPLFRLHAEGAEPRAVAV